MYKCPYISQQNSIEQHILLTSTSIMNDPNHPHYPRLFQETGWEYRHRPAEWCPVRRKWIQDGRILRSVKTSKAFVWPKDGRNGTIWGRFKDVLQSRGPDIYLTMNAEKHDYMHNRPARAEWSRHTHLDDLGSDASFRFSSKRYAPWTNKGLLGGRMQGLSYDFRTRQHGAPNRFMWTDAIWQPEPRLNKYDRYPEAVRDIAGRWYQDGHYLPQALGGPVHNERGRGVYGMSTRPIKKY